jgi:murein DD-endopeptidase MepM/ murein hydrolase activator NlpD
MRRRGVPRLCAMRRWFRNGLAAASCALVLAACGQSGRLAPLVQGSGGARTTDSARDVATGGTLTVERGDSLYKIAKRAGVPLRALIDANRIRPPYRIYPGQKLKLPATDVHVVARGDTVYGIADRYGIEPGALVRTNRLEPPYRLETGQRLRLPGGATQVARAPAPSTPGQAAKSEASPAPSVPAQTQTADPPAAQPTPPAEPRRAGPPPERSGSGFLWPVRGRVLSRFGSIGKGLKNDGINIAADKGAPVQAIENGVVAYAGNELRGFGNLLLVKHDGGWISAYAHNDELLVRTGERVRRGQVISRVGSTGSVDHPQLHFELRRGNRAVDPERYLGDRSALRVVRRFSRAFS